MYYEYASKKAEPPGELPPLTSAYALDQQAIRDFREQGHVHLRGVCTEREVAVYRAVLRSASRLHNRETRPLRERDTYGQAFLQTTNLRFASESVAAFVLAPRFGRIAAELLGARAVRIFHDQTLFKEPGGGITPWHQDQHYWPLEGPCAVSFWMPLVDCPLEMGALRFASGSHLHGSSTSHAISEQSQVAYDALIADRGHPITSRAMAMGDVSVHFGLTIHGAGSNQTNVTREAVAISFYADGTRVAVPKNPSQEHDRVTFLGNRAPGSIADHPANSVVFRFS